MISYRNADILDRFKKTPMPDYAGKTLVSLFTFMKVPIIEQNGTKIRLQGQLMADLQDDIVKDIGQNCILVYPIHLWEKYKDYSIETSQGLVGPIAEIDIAGIVHTNNNHTLDIHTAWLSPSELKRVLNPKSRS